MKYLENPKLILLFRVILGIIFIYASIDKIIDPLKFSNTIAIDTETMGLDFKRDRLCLIQICNGNYL